MRATAIPYQHTAFPRSALDQSIPARFEEQVRRHANRVAVKAGADAWTYDELNRAANRIAHRILAARGRKEEPVILVIEQGALLVAAILGALKAGKIYVPLDPGSRSHRFAEVLQDSQATLIVSEGTRTSELERLTGGVEVLRVEELGGGQSSDDPGLSLDAGAGACIYYTSGSTGRPKGVFDIHRNVLHNIMRYTNSLQISADDRLTLLQAPGFSGAISSMFGALLNGAAIFPFDVRKDGIDGIAPWLRCNAITIYHSVPSLFRHMAARAGPLPDLRLIRLEGDQTSVRDIELFKSKFPGTCLLVNGLGATECGLVRQYRVALDTPIPKGLVPVGYAVEDMEVQLVDESGRDVRPGDVGEICVRSRYLSPGYWRQPEITAAAFTSNGTDTSDRVYRTGDLGRQLADGCLEHLGRKDSQVKIRGHRIEVAEVEAALMALSDVREAAVVTRQDAGTESRLVAYVVPTTHRSLTTSFLRRHLVARLPHFMVPSVFVALDALPLSTNGKVDRRALPAPPHRRPDLDTPFVAPQNLLQHQLALVWEAVLGIAPVGVQDEFLDLGGDSLLAASMMLDVERALGRTVPLSVMSGPTVEHLADAIQREAPELATPVVSIQKGDGGRPFFFLHGDYLSGGFYCTRFARCLGLHQMFYALPPCGLDGGAVPSSYAAMAKRHVDAMRTVQPYGPYFLGGLCNGGLVAYEMARLLEHDGQEVDVLALIAAMPVSPPLARRQRLKRRIARLLAATSSIRSKMPQLAVGQQRDANPMSGPPTASSMSAPQDRRRHLMEMYHRVDREYDPGAYKSRVILFWPADDPVSPERAASRWKHVAPNVDLHVVPGTHVTCLTVHAPSAAQELGRCLV